MIDAAMVYKGIGKRASVVTLSRMAHEPALLGKDDEVIVLITDIERDVVGFNHTGVARLGQFDGNPVARTTAYFFERQVSPFTATAPASMRCAHADREGQQSWAPR